MNTTMNTANAIFGLFFTFVMVGLLNLPLQAQSIDARFPSALTSRVLSGRVGGNEVRYYSVRAKRGSVVTVNARVAWTNGASFSLDFRGFPGRDGGVRRCCEGDSYLFLDHGSRGTKEIEKSFTVTDGGRFLMAFSFNTPNLIYNFTFDGIETDDEDSLDATEDYDADDAETIIVPGTSGSRWINTGIRVRRGDTVVLNATGRVDVGAGWGVHRATGTRNFAEREDYPVNSRTRYGLAAQIIPTRGRTIQNWGYGDSRSMRVTQSGTLWLTVNDDAPDDNSGEFEVRVTIRRGR